MGLSSVQWRSPPKTEKSYASATASWSHPTKSVISPAMIQRTVKDIVEVEKRSKNVIIFGMEEQDEEDVGERVSEIFDAVGEKQDLRLWGSCTLRKQ